MLDLFEWARRYDEAAENRSADALVECFERVAAFPYSGRARPDLGADIRSVPVRSVRAPVYYVPLPAEDAAGDADRVRIVRVIAQAPDVGPDDLDA